MPDLPDASASALTARPSATSPPGSSTVVTYPLGRERLQYPGATILADQDPANKLAIATVPRLVIDGLFVALAEDPTIKTLHILALQRAIVIEPERASTARKLIRN